ncbi:unnamed protein product [Adineta ricciae]|uniref:G-protein coupled receptors family 1 profile domain-containing protein n=1 Tax=Adineta ricciae TaxID=249248 RepID=A0A814JUI9_ADIRI|nr:unnamed protein product [Adineta ricciae]CAF1040540.1 unnamed protein product [Adineta ricciae]
MPIAINLTSVGSNSSLEFSFEEINHNINIINPILSVVLSFCCIITVLGNVLVIYAVMQERYLKSATYYYMASLACADLFVGLVVMPFAIIQVIYGDYWPFGQIFCDVWHSFDVCASTASILDLCVIALDRYSAITDPISYHRAFFVKRWPYLLVAVWLCSSLISFPAVGYWHLVPRQYEDNRCLFPDDIYYILFSSFISFYIPLFVMIFVYIQIYRAAIQQLQAFKTGVKVTPSIKPKLRKRRKQAEVTPANAPPDVCLRIHRGKYHGLPNDGDSSVTDNSVSYCSSMNTSEMNANRKQIQANKYRQSFGKRLSKFSKEQKATITLAYVMGIFVICWLPFFIYNPLTAVAKQFLRTKPSLTTFEQFLVGNDLVFQLFTWLGYINSSVNPIIYAYSSREFRRAFVKYLCQCFPARIRNYLMAHHHLQLVHYSQTRASSAISAENLESNSDNNKQVAIQSSPLVSPTIVKKNPAKHCLLTKYSFPHTNNECIPMNDTTKTNILVDYCTYHDITISRVTCL